MIEQGRDREQPDGARARRRSGVGRGGRPQARTPGRHAARRSPSRRTTTLPIDWVEKTATLKPSQLTSLAYDGLVGYRRVGGAGGATLVGALATTPGAEPRRQDLRLHAPARAALLRRQARAAGGLPGLDGALPRVTRGVFPPFFHAIVGARAVRQQPARCDLSRGIETDARARTITIHLARRTPTSCTSSRFPSPTSCPRTHPPAAPGTVRRPGPGLTDSPLGHKVAAGFSSATRTSAPGRRATAPGSWTASRSRAPAADGSRAGRRRPARSADSYPRQPVRALLPPERSGARTRSPGQLYSQPGPTGVHVPQRRRPPFDDVRVRQALNFATDGRASSSSRAARSSPTRPARSSRRSPARALLPLHQARSPRRVDGPRHRAGPTLVAAVRHGRGERWVVVHVPPFRLLDRPLLRRGYSTTSASARGRA